MAENTETAQVLLLEKQYTIPFALFRKAFTAFQKRFVYPRNYAVMAILLIVSGIYAYFVVNGSESDRPFYCMIILLCLVLCAFQWYNPRKIRRNLMQGVREIEDDLYRLRIYRDYLEIGTMLPEEALPEADRESDALFEDAPQENFTGTRIYYNKDMRVVEYAEFFMIYQKKVMFYVVPKNAFSEQEQEIMRVHFDRALEKRFKNKGNTTQ
jgi:hypothetical protein